MSETRVEQVGAYLMGLQDRITTTVTAMDDQVFVSDSWEKAPGEPLQGHGITRILEGGSVFERAGCGFSHVRGPKLPPSATQHRPSWPVRRLRPWACRWYSIHATPMCPPCI